MIGGLSPTVNGQFSLQLKKKGTRPNSIKPTAVSTNGTDWIEMVTARTLEEVGDVLQLGDVVLAVAALAFQQRQDVDVLAAGQFGQEAHQLFVDDAPRLALLGRVLDARDRLATVHPVPRFSPAST